MYSVKSHAKVASDAEVIMNRPVHGRMYKDLTLQSNTATVDQQ